MSAQRKLHKIPGYCIICQVEIPYNLHNPICQNCETTKAQDSTEFFTCHRCKEQITRPEFHPLCDTCHFRAGYIL